MKFEYLPILLVVCSSTVYHLCQKSTPVGLNPIVSLIVTYSVALGVSIITFFIMAPGTNLISSLKSVNWASFTLGFGVVGLELGFLLAYRAGWDISIAGLLSNSTVALLLIPIGLLLYGEKISVSTVLGVLLCLGGLVLISK